MPEGLEAEIWRRALGDLVGRTIAAVWVDDRVADPAVLAILTGSVIEAIDRRGKVVLVRTSVATLGLHFGMTGRVIVDGRAPIERLEYSSDADDPAWDRLRVDTSPAEDAGAPAIRLNDPRRLGRVSLDPDVASLGIDLFAVDRTTLADALVGRTKALKSALLDQHVVAGLGNLCADEVLWWSGLAPDRPVDSLTSKELAALAAAIRRRLPIMLRRGGSTTGTLTPTVRSELAGCPRDGAPLRRTTIGGRTAVWCPEHQR